MNASADFRKATRWCEKVLYAMERWIATDASLTDRQLESLDFMRQRLANQVYYVPATIRQTPQHIHRMLDRANVCASALVHARTFPPQ